MPLSGAEPTGGRVPRHRLSLGRQPQAGRALTLRADPEVRDVLGHAAAFPSTSVTWMLRHVASAISALHLAQKAFSRSELAGLGFP
jgi:uncharacterized protein (DUF1778 family)